MPTTTPIEATRYNTLRTLVNKILGPSTAATKNYGYGQAFNSLAVSGSRANPTLVNADTITAEQYEELYLDLIRTRIHQIGSAAVSVDPYVTGNYNTNLSNTDKVELAYTQALESLAATIETNRFLIHTSTQADVVNLTTSASAPIVSIRLNGVSGNWNGVLTHIFQVKFATAFERQQFFNAGGEVRMSARVTYGGSNPKTVDWQTELSAMGVISFKANQTLSNNAVGTGYSIGNFNLTNTYQLCYSKAGGAVYFRNDYTIWALAVNDTTVQIKVEFDDGQPNNTTYGIDEPVLGDLTSTVQLLQPSGSATINGVVYDTVVIPDNQLPDGVPISNL